MNDPHFWWYVTRASAILAWVLMTVAVLWGILLSTRILRGADSPAWLNDLHRFLGGMALVLTLIHMGSLMLDPWLAMPLDQLLLPLVSTYRPVPVAFGILSFYVLVAVQLSSLIMNRLPRRFWKALHYSSYVAVLAVGVHGAFAGTDAGAWWYQLVATVIITASALAIALRIAVSRRKSPPARVAVTTEAASMQPIPSEVTDPLSVNGMRIIAKEIVAEGVVRLRMVRVDGRPIEPWFAGAHVTLRLPGGIERQYSLCSDPADRAHIDVAVQRAEPRGLGSSHLHDATTVGDLIEVVGPRNNFPLEAAHQYLFIAGGIGITPIRAMIEALPPTRAWRLLYLGRARAAMAFADELEAEYGDQVSIVAGDERATRVDIAAEVARVRGDVYACGSPGLLDAVIAATPPDRCHVERFVAVDRSAGLDLADVQVLAQRSGTRIVVGSEESILHALQRSGINSASSCGTGVCGTCETRVLSGTPLHLDSVMADDDKDEIGVMYPCVSRARTAELVLDV